MPHFESLNSHRTLLKQQDFIYNKWKLERHFEYMQDV